MYLQVNIMLNVIYYQRFKIVYETYESYLQTNVPKSLTTTIYLKQAIWLKDIHNNLLIKHNNPNILHACYITALVIQSPKTKTNKKTKLTSSS